MIFKILLVAALFFTATTVQATLLKAVDNPGCHCGGHAWKPQLISKAINTAKVQLKKPNIDLNAGPSTPAEYPKKFANTQGIEFELCTGVAPEHMYQYPLNKLYRKKRGGPGKFFVIFDSQENKFCGCFMTEGGGKKCELGSKPEKGKKKGESSHPVPNPAIAPV